MTREVGERIAVVEVKQEVADQRHEVLVRTVDRMANNVVAMQGEANADRELMRETLRVIAATHSKIERVLDGVQHTTRDTDEIAAQLVTAIPEIRLRSADAAADARRAADATGRVLLSPPAEKSGPVKAFVGLADRVVKAPVTKILALAVLVFALAAGSVGVVFVLQEVRAIKARLNKE